MNRLLVTPSSLSVCLVLAGCSGAATTTTGSTSSSGDALVSGSWSGSWESAHGLGGLASSSLTQSGDAITGEATFSSSPCFAGGEIEAHLAGDDLEGDFRAGGIDVELHATVTGDAMNGTYRAVSAGACTGDVGTFTARRY